VTTADPEPEVVMSGPRTYVKAVAVTAAGVLLLGWPAPGQARSGANPVRDAAAVGARNGLIAFSSGFILFDPDLSRTSQVFTVRPDGTGLHQLTHVPGDRQAGAPDIAPDGRRIAFVSNVSGNFAVWVMQADGTRQHRVLGQPGFDYLQPRWSPDGTRLAVSKCDLRLGFIASCDLVVAGADGTGVRRLVSDNRNNRAPEWSPDGRWIAFDSDRAGFVSTVWKVRTTGGRPIRLTDPDLEAFWPSWSPDGRRLVFSSNFNRPHSEVYVMRADGSQVRRLTRLPSNKAGAFFASYSPDGRRIVMSSDERRQVGSESLDLFVMDADGTNRRRVVSSQPGLVPDWGPSPRGAAR
jgi:Tol biopolymer transport system component